MNGKKLPHHGKVIGAPVRGELGEILHHRAELVAAAAASYAFAEFGGERLHHDGVQPHQPHVTQGGSQLARVVEFHSAARTHRVACIQKHPHRHARLHLEHFQKQFFEPQVSTPVYGPEIVSMVEMAVVQKLLAAPGEARAIAASHKAVEGLLPVDGEALEFFEKLPVEQRCVGHGTACQAAEACAAASRMIVLRIVSGVCPSAWASKFRIMRWRRTEAATASISSILR